MRYPDFLKKNGRIGYIAPSYGAGDDYHRARFDAALERFAVLGYRNVLGPNCYAADGIGKSSTAENCAAEINDFFLSDRSDIIISCGGGETMCEDLPLVDFEAIAKAKPKWYMGYSDNTNLTFPLAVLCDTASIYGQCAGTFGMRDWHTSLYDDVRILTGQTDEKMSQNAGDQGEQASRGTCREEKSSGAASPEPESSLCFTFRNYSAWEGPEPAAPEAAGMMPAEARSGADASEENISEANRPEAAASSGNIPAEEDPLASWNLNTPSCFTACAPGSIVPTEEKVCFRGRLLGGCLDCLVAHCGTKYDRVKEFCEKYKEDGIVWFLEACDLNPMSIRRALWQLREAGWFRYAKGFIFGRPLHFGEVNQGLDCENAVLGIMKEFDVPILLNTDLGHLPPAIPYITGAIAEVTAESGRLTVKQMLI